MLLFKNYDDKQWIQMEKKILWSKKHRKRLCILAQFLLLNISRS